jgi:hypothetical protein
MTRSRGGPLLAAIVAAALLVGCGGDDDSADAAPAGGGGGTAAGTDDKAVQYSECMRSNGVPDFPDPQNGRLMLRAGPGGVNPDSPEFQRAQEACQHLAPSGGQGGGGAGNAAMQAQVLEYAKCMRQNGVPNFPDPNFSGGGVRMRLPQGIDENSPAFTKAQQACQEHLSGLGTP